MTGQRLPKAKYLRQLRRMRFDLVDLRAEYLVAAMSTTSDHLAGRFGVRAVELGDVIHQLGEVTEALADLRGVGQ